MHKIMWTTQHTQNLQGTSWSIQFETKQRKIYRIDEHMERDLKISETIANHRVVDTMLKMQKNEDENSITLWDARKIPTNFRILP